MLDQITTPPALTPGEVRRGIMEIEAIMRAAISGGALVECTKTMPLRHTFIPGGYARELTIPAGTLIVGKIHKEACLNFVMSGQITVLTEDGIRTLTAPASFRSEPGVKRVGLAHTDTVWTTVHITKETDLERLEKELTCETYEEFGLIEAQNVKEIAA
jgi:hypothetical protein